MIRFVKTQEWSALKGVLIYRASEYSFDFEPASNIDVIKRAGEEGTTSISIGTLQIEVGVETQVILFVWGLHSYNLWQEKSLPSIEFETGCVKVSLDEKPIAGVSLELAKVGQWITVRDPYTGWICVSLNSEDQATEYVEFAACTVAGIKEGHLVSLWLNPVMT